MNNRTPARKKQTKSVDTQSEIVRDVTIRPPILVRGGIYSTEDILNNLGICRATLLKWRRNRVHCLKPLDLGTNVDFYSGSAVIRFLESYQHSVNG